MADEENKVGSQPIIIKKIKKGGHGGHHGGAWKVAYADFVTAMMAFFLLLWLLSVTTDEQKDGIADYFSPSVAVSTSSGGAGVFGGQSPFESESSIDSANPFGFMVDKPVASDDSGASTAEDVPDQREVDQDEAERVIAEEEERQFDEAEEELEQAIENTPEIAQLADSLLIEHTPEGLRIQIVDQENKPMFPLGSSDMFDHTHKLLTLVAKVINKLPNKIAIAGHTDATPYREGATFTNWELSADRANASRRVIEEEGVKHERLFRISGKAATELLEPENPESPRNRRIAILLLREVPLTKGTAPIKEDAPQKQQPQEITEAPKEATQPPPETLEIPYNEDPYSDLYNDLP